MKFSHPLYLFLLIPLFLFFLLLEFLGNNRASQRDRTRARLEAHPRGLAPQRFLAILGQNQMLSRLFFFLALVFGIIALAGPSYGQRAELSRRYGLNLAIALDISRSMDCNDHAPTRLKAALSLAKDIVSDLEDIPVSLALGKGEALLVQPLSEDREQIFAILNTIKTSSFTATGTSLEAIIDAALDSFPPQSAGRPLVLLFSDGEALSGSLQVALDRAERAGAEIISIGFGSEEGAIVPGFEDKEYISSLKADALKYISERTGAKYYHGNEPHLRREIVKTIKAYKDKGVSDFWQRKPIERQGLFIALTLVFFIASRFILFWRPK